MNGLRSSSDFYPEFGRALSEGECLLGCLSYALMFQFVSVSEPPAQIIVEYADPDADRARFFAGRVLVDDGNGFRSSIDES